MKVVLVFIAMTFLLFAQEQRVKIDMHGGKDSYTYEKKNGFRSSGMGLSTFLDNNVTKEVKPTKE